MAIGNDGRCNVSACYTHDDREFLGGFSDWAKNLAESRSARDDERKAFVREVVKPLQEKLETVCVVPGSDAEAHVAKRFPPQDGEAGAQQPHTALGRGVPQRVVDDLSARAGPQPHRHEPRRVQRRGALPRNLLLALLTGRIRLRGNPRLLLRFARGFAV